MNRKAFFLLSALLLCQLSYAQVTLSNYYRDNAYVFDDANKVLKTELFSTYKSQLGLSTDDEMILDEEGTITLDGNGDFRTQSRFIQKYKGYPVEGKAINVMSKCGVALLMSGSVLEGLDIDITGLISETTALDEALDHINAPVYTWEDTEMEELNKTFDEDRTLYPTGELVITKKIGENYEDIVENYELCWKFNISYFDTITVDTTDVDTFVVEKVVYVNSHTGDIYSEYNPKLYGSHHTADQWTWYYGQRFDEMSTFKCDFCVRYSLQDFNTQIATYRLNGGTRQIYDANNNWVEDDRKTAAQTHWALTIAQNYFNNHLYTGIGGAMFAYINDADPQNAGAAYSFTNDVIAIRNDLSYSNPNVSGAALDVIIHEFAHALIERTAKLDHTDVKSDSYAMHEAFADIFGLLGETWKWGWCDWSIGEDLGYAHERSYHDPQNESTPSSVSYNDSWDNLKPPYSNGGSVRKWFNHMSQGEWHWPNPYGGIGLAKSELLVRDLVVWNLWSHCTIPFAASQSLHLASEHWGTCSPEWKAVERAWYDVGIGSISSCKPGRLNGERVTLETNVGSTNSPVVFDVDIYDAESITVSDYDWHLPSNWSGTLSNGDATFTLTSVNNDYTSKTISVDITYTENGGSTQYETFETVLHFSTECESSSSKPGRPTNIDEGLFASSINDVMVYPNPAHSKLFVNGVLQGTKMQLFNTLGQVVYHDVSDRAIETLDISNFQVGVYILKLTDEQGNTITHRITKH